MLYQALLFPLPASPPVVGRRGRRCEWRWRPALEKRQQFGVDLILMRGRDAFVGVLKSGLHAPEPELVEQALRDPGTWPVGAVKLDCQILVELGAVADEARAKAVENLDWQALGIGSGLQHNWSYHSSVLEYRV